MTSHLRSSTAYFKRLYYLTACSSPKKLYNYLLNKFEKKTGRCILKSLPVQVTFEPCNICNLRCPGCVTGAGHPECAEQGFLSLEKFKHIFDQIKDYIFSVTLHRWGEPFLNKDIFSIIDYASSSRCDTTLHSNFNIFDEDMAIKAIDSRLTHIYLSIDGATQETYQMYRRGGDLSRVFKNIGILTEMKKKRNSVFPLLTWKYLVFPFNAHEIGLAKQKARSLKINSIEFNPGNMDHLATVGVFRHYDPFSKNTETHFASSCSALWDSIFINPDGKVMPCCRAFREVDVFGDLTTNSLKDVWNNDFYLNARRTVSERRLDASLRYPCKECGLIRNLNK